MGNSIRYVRRERNNIVKEVSIGVVGMWKRVILENADLSRLQMKKILHYHKGNVLVQIFLAFHFRLKVTAPDVEKITLQEVSMRTA